MDGYSNKRIERLADLDAVKWVTGLEHGSSDVRRLNADEIAEIADLEMHQPYPAEPNTWSNAGAHGKYLTVMAIVATPSSDRGAQLVAEGRSHDNQIDGLAIGEYSCQQRRLASLTGECSEGCSLANIRLRAVIDGQGYMDVSAVCRHTLAKCKSCLQVPTEKRLELLERLLIECRSLIQELPVNGHAFMQVAETVLTLDGLDFKEIRSLINDALLVWFRGKHSEEKTADGTRSVPATVEGGAQ